MHIVIRGLNLKRHCSMLNKCMSLMCVCVFVWVCVCVFVCVCERAYTHTYHIHILCLFVTVELCVQDYRQKVCDNEFLQI